MRPGELNGLPPLESSVVGGGMAQAEQPGPAVRVLGCHARQRGSHTFLSGCNLPRYLDDFGAEQLRPPPGLDSLIC